MPDLTPARIRTASPADLDLIVGIAQACFGLSAWGAAHFAPHPARIIFVADSDGARCIGYSVIESIADEAELQALAVLPEFRRRHFGAALLNAARRHALERGARTLFLEVRESNALAQTFYRRFGFTPCGRRPGYYRLPEETALVMKADLPALP